MYVPAVNRIEDRELIVELLQRYSFATLVTTAEGTPVATHLPILVEPGNPGEPLVLLGHMAKANSQWKSMGPGETVLAIFAGPHGYVSPRWYVSRPNVPTWNYVAIHAYGRAEIIEDRDFAVAHLHKMIGTFDPSLSYEQPESTSPEYLEKLLPGIVVFRITVERIDAKAKLNQNKQPEDRQGVIKVYSESEIADERDMGSMMTG